MATDIRAYGNRSLEPALRIYRMDNNNKVISIKRFDVSGNLVCPTCENSSSAIDSEILFSKLEVGFPGFDPDVDVVKYKAIGSNEIYEVCELPNQKLDFFGNDNSIVVYIFASKELAAMNVAPHIDLTFNPSDLDLLSQSGSSSMSWI